MVNSFNLSLNESSKEVKVFLPDNCPNLITRLMAFLIYPNTVLVVLCGDSLSLKELEEALSPLRDSKQDQELFKQNEINHQLPFHLNENIINLIIINCE